MTPDANFFLQFVGTIGFIALVIDRVWTIANRSKAQKREVSFAEEFARKADVERVEGDLEKLEQKVDGKFEALRGEIKRDTEKILAAGENRAVEIHRRLNQMVEKVGELVGRGR